MAKSQQLADWMDQAFEPYAKAVGFFLREWNSLQENFGKLFSTILPFDNKEISRAIWYSVPNDRWQRKMIFSVLPYCFEDDHRMALRNTIVEEIKWCLDKAEHLGPLRDAAAHVPMVLSFEAPLSFIPLGFYGNPHAKKFDGKTILADLALYTQRAATLRGYVWKLDGFLQARLGDFPKRPSWPERQDQSRGTKSSRKATKQ